MSVLSGRSEIDGDMANQVCNPVVVQWLMLVMSFCGQWMLDLCTIPNQKTDAKLK